MLQSLLKRAAAGECEAQAELANRALAMGAEGSLGIAEAVSSAEIFARMAATHRQPKHAKMLAGILMIRAALVEDNCEAEATMMAGEALAWLNGAADAGDEEAGNFVVMIGEMGIPPEAFEMAHEMCEDGKDRE